MSSNTPATGGTSSHGAGTGGPGKPPRLELLDPAESLRQYRSGVGPSETHPQGLPARPPWTWGLYDQPDEQTDLARVVHAWVATYNQQLAIDRDHIVPPCWPAHTGLAAELAVWAWSWHDAHLTAESPTQAAEFYTRHLPAFRERVRGYLGANPDRCWDGEHYQHWHRNLDQRLAQYGDTPTHHEALAAFTSGPRYGFCARTHPAGEPATAEHGANGAGPPEEAG